MSRAPAGLAAAALLCAGWALTLWSGPWADESVSDLYVYRTQVDAFLDGLVPYRDAPFEYPPLALAPLLLGAVAGTGEDEYRLAFAGVSLAATLTLLFATGALARLTGGDRRLAMLALAALPLLAGAMVRTHFDALPGALAVAGVALVASSARAGGERRHGTPAVASDPKRIAAGFALLALGTATKAFPALAAAAALAWLAGRGDRRAAIAGAASFGAVLAAIALAWLATSPSGMFDALDYHAERPIQVESSPALVLRALDAIGLGEATAVKSHRSDGIVHPAESLMTGIFVGFAVAALARFALLAARRPGPRGLALAALGATLGLMVFGTVLSPQFLIWSAPLGALALAWRMHGLAAAIAGATVLTLVEFPSRYFDVVAGEPFAVALVAARNALLLLAMMLAEAALAREPVASPASAAGAARSSEPGRPDPRRPAPR